MGTEAVLAGWPRRQARVQQYFRTYSAFRPHTYDKGIRAGQIKILPGAGARGVTRC